MHCCFWTHMEILVKFAHVPSRWIIIPQLDYWHVTGSTGFVLSIQFWAFGYGRLVHLKGARANFTIISIVQFSLILLSCSSLSRAEGAGGNFSEGYRYRDTGNSKETQISRKRFLHGFGEGVQTRWRHLSRFSCVLCRNSASQNISRCLKSSIDNWSLQRNSARLCGFCCVLKTIYAHICMCRS